jgi:uncharacterized membrane protein YccC
VPPLTLIACVSAGCALAIIVSVAPLVRSVHWQVAPRPLKELLARQPWDSGQRELVARIAVVAVAGTLLAVITVDPQRAYWVVASGIVVVGFIPGRVPALHRGLHRMLGTAVGAGVYLGMAALDPGPWALVAIVFALQFFTEILIVRNYALAVSLLTPLALTLATAAAGDLGDVAVALERILDTIVGAAIAVATAFMHRPDVERRRAPASGLTG